MVGLRATRAARDYGDDQGGRAHCPHGHCTEQPARRRQREPGWQAHDGAHLPRRNVDWPVYYAAGTAARARLDIAVGHDRLALSQRTISGHPWDERGIRGSSDVGTFGASSSIRPACGAGWPAGGWSHWPVVAASPWRWAAACADPGQADPP
jgi:hypothetical protein